MTDRITPSTHTFGRGIRGSMLAVGSAALIGQVVSVLAAPALSRIYDPAAFGMFTVFASLILFVGSLSMLQFDMAIPLTASVIEAREVELLCGGVLLLTTGATLGIWATWGRALSSLMGMPRLADYGLLLAAGVFLFGAYSALNARAVRERAYRRIAGAQLAQGVTGTSTSLVLGLAGLTNVGLLVSNVALQAAGVAALLGVHRANDERRTGPVTIKGVRAVARRYRRFPTYVAPHQFLLLASLSAPPVVLSSVFGVLAAGQYAMAYRVCLLPVTVLGFSMSRIYFGESASLRSDRGQLSRLTRDVAGWLAAASVPIFATLAVFGPSIFAAVLGQEWRTAGVYAQILAPWLAVALVSSSLSQLPLVLERQRAASAYGVVDACLRILVLAVGAMSKNSFVLVALLSAIGAAYNTFMLFWCLRLARVRIAPFLTRIGYCSLPVVVALIAGLWVSQGRGAWITLVAAIVSGGIGLSSSLLLNERLPRVADHRAFRENLCCVQGAGAPDADDEGPVDWELDPTRLL